MNEIRVSHLNQVVCPAANNCKRDVDGCGSGLFDEEMDARNCHYFAGFRFEVENDTFIVQCKYKKVTVKEKIRNILEEAHNCPPEADSTEWIREMVDEIIKFTLNEEM